MNTFKRTLASLLIVCMATAGMPMMANAGIVSTEQAITSQSAVDNRTKVDNFLARADVREAMVAQGIDGAAAADRVKAMSDAEVAQLANRVDQAPAGGEILGILFTVFIVLLITDILGLTKVFPFTRSVR
ncbi:MAG TPA: PA2779 family protein [Burkholderiaceae bacterium]